ncbi:Subtilisin-like protease SBT4.3 [Camellia lanceoleosa]|uniref:Subtilisin-like protease SBT4.3 n=1 Tax=Camellia lanceoleosa TaxID=1840588 RepID=A0ACC0G1Y9_9ERIC|nr:Subtilisin-like protease SBT4.3 [Camellia lanceoleosa]
MELQEAHYPLPGLLPTKSVIQTLAAKILTCSPPLTTPSADGIDVISISLRQENALDVTIDSLSIGSFHAMERGVLTVHSAGNTGLSTVRASGNAVNGFHLNGSEFSLVQGMEVTGTCDEYSPGLCEVGCLDSSKVKGKIVVCNDVKGMNEAHRAGALGSIVSHGLVKDASFVVPLPALLLNQTDNALLQSYIRSTKMPQANILKSESLHDSAAPIVASFSSKGPNIIISGILKPDITALGIDILAAYSLVASPTDDLLDKKKSVKFSVLSRTSISCPHVAGVAAYLTSLHPDWSPSAIKSTLMTTTPPMNAKKNPAAEFGYGAGHLDPVNSANPGLVYETFKDNYIKMSCSMGYNSSKLRKMLGDNSNCPEGPKGSSKELNYPSMTVQVEAKKPFTAKFPRTVTNVGFKNSPYKAEISKDDLVNVSMEPRILSFNSLNEKKSFVGTISGEGLDDSKSVSVSLVWSDGTHRVQSPIVIYTSMYFNA